MNVPRACFLGLIVAIPAQSFALGIRATDQDPAAIARGRAFTATADNPSAIYYNPAGITQLPGSQLRVGAYAISLKSHYVDANKVESETKDMIAPLPEIYFTQTLKDPSMPFSYGIGIYTPYGLVNEWPDNPTFRAMRGRITYLTVNPVAAWKLDEGLSFAAGATLNYADTRFKQTILARSLFSPGGELEFHGDDFDLGFNLGVLWQPHKKHSFGVTYRSATTMNFSGEARTGGADLAGIPSGTQTANAELNFPQFVILGYSFRPTPLWNLEINIDWTDWDSVNSFTLQQATGSTAIPLNWQSSFIYELGVTRFLDAHWQISAGYAYTENSVPASNFMPLVPDEDFHFFGLGAGWKNERWSWDLAYQFGYAGKRTVSGSTLAFPIGASANGTYDFISHAVSFSLGYKL
jgi:long-chain fatty acid transport protein